MKIKNKKRYQKPSLKRIRIDNEISVLMISPPPDPPKKSKRSSYFGDDRDNSIHWA